MHIVKRRKQDACHIYCVVLTCNTIYINDKAFPPSFRCSLLFQNSFSIVLFSYLKHTLSTGFIIIIHEVWNIHNLISILNITLFQLNVDVQSLIKLNIRFRMSH